MSDQIDIPPEAYEPKSLFPDRPGPAVVKEIREWIKTEAPWLWRGHTHSRPDKAEAEKIRYIAEFELPNKAEAPCPICRPKSGKFNKGYIAWFPVTGCIRLMGQDCFRALNPEEDRFAKDELEDTLRRQRDLNYVIANLPNRGVAIAAIEAVLPIAKRLDELQDQLGHQLIRTYGIDLWRHVRDDGRLRVFDRNETDDLNAPQAFTLVDHAPVVGASLIDPSRKDFHPSLSSSLRTLKSISLPDDIYSAEDAELKKAARDFSRSVNTASDVFQQIEEARRFVSVQNTATLRSWGQHPGAAAKLYMRRKDNQLVVGRSAEDARPIPIDPQMDRSLPTLPAFVTGD